MKDQQEVKEEEDYVYPSLRLRRYTQGQSFSSSAVTRRPPGEADEQIKKEGNVNHTPLPSQGYRRLNQLVFYLFIFLFK